MLKRVPGASGKVVTIIHATGYGDKWIGGRRHPLHRHNRLRVAGGEGVRVGGDEVAVAVAAGSPAVGVLWDTCQRTTVGRKTSVCS